MIKKVRSWSKPDILHLIGRKKVDWSIFTYGTQIPNEFHEDFAIANNNYLKIGERIPIKLNINKEVYNAHLVYIERKDSNVGSLQLRYDYNKDLRLLLQKAFEKSYNYLTSNRKEESKKQVQTPEEIAEYIDFYQTEKAYTYNVLFHTRGYSSKPSFWWVNQGQTYNEEREGGFLWAPQKSKQGRPLPHHVKLLEPQVGDFVFCYSSLELRSIGIVTSKAINSTKPSVIKSHDWEEEGYLLKLKYYDFESNIRKDEIPEEMRLTENGPFDVNGNIKQGYFYELSEQFTRKMINLFASRFPKEVRIKIGSFEIDKQEEISIKENQQVYLSYINIIDHIYSYIKSKGFYYPKEEVINLFLSLKTKPYVILSGISGTGKTKMVQWFAESLGATEKNGQFTLIPVRPDWSDGSDLLGYVDIKGDFKEGPLTKAIRAAEEHPELPFFVLLDEMNLARVEYYFSDILSVMESRRWEDGKVVSSTLLSEEVAKEQVTLPNNLYVIGTVNMDETTHPFSKKVLDRVNTIEFNRVELDNLSFLHDLEEVDPLVIEQCQLASKYLHLKDLFKVDTEIIEKATSELVRINKSLQLINAHIGYRVRDEICFYLAYNKEGALMSFEEAFDHCILQKILPRLSGSDSRIDQLLRELYLLFTNTEYQESEDSQFDEQSAIYPKSARKVIEMLRRLQADGFTSFWIS